MWLSSYTNAYSKGLEHTIKISDIPLPKFCIYLGIELDYTAPSKRASGRIWNGPNIDRIDPTKGYILGNIQVISDLANRMKTNATVEQLIAFAEGVLRIHAQKSF